MMISLLNNPILEIPTYLIVLIILIDVILRREKVFSRNLSIRKRAFYQFQV